MPDLDWPVGLNVLDGADITTTVTDRSGSNNHGYFIGGATSTAKVIGKLGQAFQFDGVNDNVRIPDHASLGGMASLTISSWVKVPSSIANNAVFLNKRHSSSPFNSYLLSVDTSNGRFVTSIYNSGGTENGFTSSANGSLVTTPGSISQLCTMAPM